MVSRFKTPPFGDIGEASARLPVQDVLTCPELLSPTSHCTGSIRPGDKSELVCRSYDCPIAVGPTAIKATVTKAAL